MQLSEISVAMALNPVTLKAAWMTLFLSLSSCKHRGATVARHCQKDLVRWLCHALGAVKEGTFFSVL
jgi:hypothetical protein